MIFFDFETTNHSHGSALDKRNRILMVSWAIDGGEITTYRGDIVSPAAAHFWAALVGADSACAYNAKFDMGWLLRLGFDIDSLTWHDPMLAEKVILGNEKLPMNLGAVSERYGFDAKDAMIDSMMRCGLCPSLMPQKRLQARCVRDVRTMRAIERKQSLILNAKEQLHLYRNRCDFSVVLAHMEAAGMHLDRERVELEYTDALGKHSDLCREVDNLTGGINMNSHKQRAAFLYDTLKLPELKNFRGNPLRTAAGGRKTDKATMVKLAMLATTPEQENFTKKAQELSKLGALLSKNLEFFKGVCDERAGWFHATLNQIVTATHRLASSGMPLQFKAYAKPKSVQMQNMPRTLKRCFSAPEGYLIAEVDAMQLEFRVAAFLGQDKQAMQDILNPDFDAHCRSASIMNEMPYSQFLARYREGDTKYKDLRQGSKADTFKPLYGGTRGTPAQERYYKAFVERYAGIAVEQESWLAEVMATGMHRTKWGMEFKWDTCTNSRGVAMNKRTHKPVGPQVFNYPIQNLATAEIVPIAIVALYKRCKAEELDVKFVNTIHDSTICYVRDDEATVRAFTWAAIWAFTKAVYEHLELFYGVDFNVPLGIEMNIGEFWGEGITTTYDDTVDWGKK